MTRYLFRYIVKNIPTRTVFLYNTKADNFDNAYKNFKKDIKNSDVLSVRRLDLNNLKKAWAKIKRRNKCKTKS